jgi:ankyrin repeat protein
MTTVTNYNYPKISAKQLAEIKHIILVACSPKLGVDDGNNIKRKNLNTLKQYFDGPNPQLHPDTLITENFTCLMLCAYYKFNDGVKFLLKCGASSNYKNNDGLSPLHISSQVGHPIACLELLKNKADINSMTKIKQTPMMFVCQNGDEMTSDLLLEHEPVLTVKDDHNKTCVDYAREHNHPELVSKINHIIYQAMIPTNNNLPSSKTSTKI